LFITTRCAGWVVNKLGCQHLRLHLEHVVQRGLVGEVVAPVLESAARLELQDAARRAGPCPAVEGDDVREPESLSVTDELDLVG